MKKFDYLEVKGSHEDLGRAIGTKFASVIQKNVAAKQKKIPHYDSYLIRTEPYYKATCDAFPDLIAEMTATAHAAGVGVADYFAINCREVPRDEEPDHCTVAVSFGEHGAVVGHNEDWEGADPSAIYILKATVGDTTFMGLQYRVTVPGVSIAMNNWGLVQCINDLNSEAQVGVPKNFIARAVLDCKTLDEAEKLIRNTKRASGFNHVLVQGREVRNIEIAGDKVGIQKVTATPYVHTNHYLTDELIPSEKFHTKSSEERFLRASELVKSNMTIVEMKALLGDIKNKEYPISRADATLGSMIVEPNFKKIYICHGPPHKGSYEEYII